MNQMLLAQQQQAAQHQEQMQHMQQMLQQSLTAQQQMQETVAAQSTANAQHQQQQTVAIAQANEARSRAQTRPTSELSSIIDPRILEKLPNYNGDEAGFTEWEIVFSSVAGLLGIEDSMNIAVNAATDSEVSLSELGDEEIRKQSKALWYMLIQTVKGKALRICNTAERLNGLMAWRIIHKEC